MTPGRRPVLLTLFSLLFLGIGFWNGLRIVNGIGYSSVFQEYQVDVQPIYLILTGALWLVVGLIACWGLWKVKSWAWYLSIISIVCYDSWYWFDRLVIQTPHSNWLFALAVTIIIAGLFLLYFFNPKTRDRFRKH
jgi:uncharacterized membrane protein (DUF2068 family)